MSGDQKNTPQDLTNSNVYPVVVHLPNRVITLVFDNNRLERAEVLNVQTSELQIYATNVTHNLTIIQDQFPNFH